MLPFQIILSLHKPAHPHTNQHAPTYKPACPLILNFFCFFDICYAFPCFFILCLFTFLHFSWLLLMLSGLFLKVCKVFPHTKNVCKVFPHIKFVCKVFPHTKLFPLFLTSSIVSCASLYFACAFFPAFPGAVQTFVKFSLILNLFVKFSLILTSMPPMQTSTPPHEPAHPHTNQHTPIQTSTPPY